MTMGIPLVDLRSDTVTKPSDAMRRAMVEAEVGDDVFGEDSTVLRLEGQVAELLGHEAALFVPTGSLANWLALRVLTPPGTEVLCDAAAHIVRAELGSSAVLGVATTRTWPTVSGAGLPGQVDPETVAAMLATGDNPYLVRTAVVAVENTHNFAGGVPQPLTSLTRLRHETEAAGVAVHMDGARLWNAVAATGTSEREYARCATTVSVCFSKGLGAPVGSALVGPRDLIAEARVWRKRAGAGWRQAGLLAAAASFALDNHRDDIAADHARAAELAAGCAQACPDAVDPDAVLTNIVVLATPNASAVVEYAAERGVLVMALDTTHVRAITHRDIADPALHHAVRVLGAALAEAAAPPPTFA